MHEILSQICNQYATNILYFRVQIQPQIVRHSMQKPRTFTSLSGPSSNARNALKHRIPECLCKFPTDVLDKAHIHSIVSFASHVEFNHVDSYYYIYHSFISSFLTKYKQD